MPIGGRKRHYFLIGEGISVCGRWAALPCMLFLGSRVCAENRPFYECLLCHAAVLSLNRGTFGPLPGCAHLTRREIADGATLCRTCAYRTEVRRLEAARLESARRRRNLHGHVHVHEARVADAASTATPSVADLVDLLAEAEAIAGQLVLGRLLEAGAQGLDKPTPEAVAIEYARRSCKQSLVHLRAPGARVATMPAPPEKPNGGVATDGGLAVGVRTVCGCVYGPGDSIEVSVGPSGAIACSKCGGSLGQAVRHG